MRSTFSDACLSRVRPTGVEPVKLSLRRRLSAMIGAETSPEVEVVMTFSTPAGSPASSSRRAKYRVVSGVSSAGLTIAVQPAAMAGAILRVAMASGKFQGVMRNDGPTGRWVTIIRPLPSGLTP